MNNKESQFSSIEQLSASNSSYEEIEDAKDGNFWINYYSREQTKIDASNQIEKLLNGFSNNGDISKSLQQRRLLVFSRPYKNELQSKQIMECNKKIRCVARSSEQKIQSNKLEIVKKYLIPKKNSMQQIQLFNEDKDKKEVEKCKLQDDEVKKNNFMKEKNHEDDSKANKIIVAKDKESFNVSAISELQNFNQKQLFKSEKQTDVSIDNNKIHSQERIGMTQQQNFNNSFNKVLPFTNSSYQNKEIECFHVNSINQSSKDVADTLFSSFKSSNHNTQQQIPSYSLNYQISLSLHNHQKKYQNSQHLLDILLQSELQTQPISSQQSQGSIKQEDQEERQSRRFYTDQATTSDKQIDHQESNNDFNKRNQIQSKQSITEGLNSKQILINKIQSKKYQSQKSVDNASTTVLIKNEISHEPIFKGSGCKNEDNTFFSDQQEFNAFSNSCKALNSYIQGSHDIKTVSSQSLNNSMSSCFNLSNKNIKNKQEAFPYFLGKKQSIKTIAIRHPTYLLNSSSNKIHQSINLNQEFSKLKYEAERRNSLFQQSPSRIDRPISAQAQSSILSSNKLMRNIVAQKQSIPTTNIYNKSTSNQKINKNFTVLYKICNRNVIECGNKDQKSTNFSTINIKPQK